MSSNGSGPNWYEILAVVSWIAVTVVCVIGAAHALAPTMGLEWRQVGAGIIAVWIISVQVADGWSGKR